MSETAVLTKTVTSVNPTDKVIDLCDYPADETFKTNEDYGIDNIKSIDGIPVTVSIRRYRYYDPATRREYEDPSKGGYVIIIRSTTVMCCEASRNNIELGIISGKTLNEVLDNLQNMNINYTKPCHFKIFYNKEAEETRSSCCHHHDNGPLRIISKLSSRSQNSPVIELEEMECCVCKEVTQTKTLCKHRLCLKCWHKIENDGIMRCPMCRKDCSFIRKPHECCVDEDE